MEPAGNGMNPALLWAIILVATAGALAFVILVVLPDCASLPIRGEVPGECGAAQQGVIAVCAAVFLAGAVYSGYRLVRVAAGIQS